MTLPRLLPMSLSLSLLLAACSQTPTQPTPALSATQPALSPAQSRTNEALRTFAQQLARSMTDPGVRTLIAQQTARQFDGDTEALYSTLAPMAAGTQSFAQALSGGIGAQSLHDLTARVPNLQVAVRGAAWDPARTVPWVAVAQEGGDEFAAVTAYDAQGNAHVLDGRTAPDRPVVVVGVNERVDASGQVVQSAPVPAATLAAQGCYQVKLVRVDLYNDMEPWTKGKAEIWVAVKGSGIGWHGQLTMITEPGDYLDAIQVFGCTDSDVRFYWYEKDGTNLDFEISVDGYGFGIKIDDSNDFLGSTTMRKALFEGTTVNKVNLGNLSQYTH
ncbi:DUF3103 domain-containing protein (plasmid) [Deinococcus taeanensis]|uniref:DUF3103 family protein n=1 Tax=Deinococcus taeanensis TaxID=2737050 RepID=UPI001CDD3AD0|nr:DUF3103 family protein [Deinococcus taeanensis]UBV45183.1 DUF3103 domain-containing protein [Deinococcus taeanensis]